MKRAVPSLIALGAVLLAGAALFSGAWFADDALRLWRICLNWICIGSPDINPGHHGLAFGQPLWVILLSAGFSLGGRVAATAVALQFALFCGGALLLLACHRLTRVEGRSKVQVLGDGAKVLAVAALLAASDSFREYVASGLEFALVFFLVAAVAYSFARGAARTSSPAGIATATLACSLLILTRYDMAWVVAPLAAAAAWRLRREPAPVWRPAALGLVPLGLWIAYALLHYGTVVSSRPENDLLQALPRRAILAHGQLYLMGSLIQDPLTFLLLVLSLAAGVAALRRPRRDTLPLLLGLGSLAYVASTVWRGGDTASGRMFCPIACVSAAALACAPAFRLRTYLFTGCFAAVFFDLSRVSLWKSAESRRPRTVELFREWGITDDYAAQHRAGRSASDFGAALTAGAWRERLRQPRSLEPLLLTASPGLDGLVVGPGRYIADYRAVGPARPELSGAVAMSVKFVPAEPGETEPLLSFGDPSSGTLILAEHLPGGGLRFQIWKNGLVPIFSQCVRRLDTAVPHRLIVRYGTRTTGGTPQGSIVLMLDGVLLKDYPCEVRHYNFNEVVAGWNTQGAPGCLPRFRGEITSLAAPDESEFQAGTWPLPVAPRNLVDLEVEFSRTINSDEPIIVTGHERAGDIVFFRRVDAGKIEFGVEHWGQAPVFGPVVPIDDAARHHLTIALGPLFVHSDAVIRPDCIHVMLDARPVLDTRQELYPFTEAEVYALDNPLAGSFCARDFLGEVVSVSTRSMEPALAAVKALVEGGAGPISMSLRFDGSSVGWGLGLLEAGVPGAGCIVYVVNEDPSHVRFYLDHWGAGGITGPRVEIDRAKAHELNIEMGSLVAPGAPSPGAADLVRYTLDGRVVLEGQSPWPPVEHVPIHLLENALKSSNVAIPFDGTCLSVTRGGRTVRLSY